jgi:hypothetical protein
VYVRVFSIFILVSILVYAFFRAIGAALIQ